MAKKKITKEDIINDDSLTPQDKYHKYLKTDEWQSIRDLVLQRDNYTCRCCGRTKDDKGAALTVHHREYTHLFDEQNNLDDLICLCKYCHIGIHRVPSNRQRFKFKETTDK